MQHQPQQQQQWPAGATMTSPEVNHNLTEFRNADPAQSQQMATMRDQGLMQYHPDHYSGAANVPQQAAEAMLTQQYDLMAQQYIHSTMSPDHQMQPVLDMSDLGARPDRVPIVQPLKPSQRRALAAQPHLKRPFNFRKQVKKYPEPPMIFWPSDLKSQPRVTKNVVEEYYNSTQRDVHQPPANATASSSSSSSSSVKADASGISADSVWSKQAYQRQQKGLHPLSGISSTAYKVKEQFINQIPAVGTVKSPESEHPTESSISELLPPGTASRGAYWGIHQMVSGAGIEPAVDDDELLDYNIVML
jgi:hypothetical protein